MARAQTGCAGTAVTTQSLLPTFSAGVPPTPAHIQEKDTRPSTSRALTSLRQIHSTGSRMLGRSRVGCPGRGLPFLNRSLAAGDRFWHRTCLQHSRDVPTQHQNQSQTHFWMGARGRPKCSTSLQKQGFFLSPRFFTPFRESAAAPSIL